MKIKIRNKLVDNLIRVLLNKLGFKIIRYNQYLDDFTSLDKKIWDIVKPYTMTSPERVSVLIDAVKYVVENRVDGAFVECGVWKGGSAMAMALTLRELDQESRDIYLYDTFSGMVAPSDIDISHQWGSAQEIFSLKKTSDDTSDWCMASLDEVKRNLNSTLYPKNYIHFVRGDVKSTIPTVLPKKISILRLDTDWYSSTKHELIHLFPLLSKNGILIIDDYSCWEGSKKAVDEYISENNLCLFLSRIDSSAIILVKT